MVDVSDLIGVPYREHGRTKDGYDCYGLVMEVERRLGRNLPDYDYERHEDALTEALVRETVAEGRVRRIDRYVDGAMVLMENSSGMKSHIGVYVGGGNVCHCNMHGVHLDSVDRLSEIIAGIYVWQK